MNSSDKFSTHKISLGTTYEHKIHIIHFKRHPSLKQHSLVNPESATCYSREAPFVVRNLTPSTQQTSITADPQQQQQ